MSTRSASLASIRAVSSEAVRAATFTPEAAWIPVAMRPIAELSSGEQAHTFVRGLTLAHFDSTLCQIEAADRFLSYAVEAGLAARGVEAFVNPNVPINYDLRRRTLHSSARHDTEHKPQRGEG
jgi:hypothetical protein